MTRLRRARAASPRGPRQAAGLGSQGGFAARVFAATHGRGHVPRLILGYAKNSNSYIFRSVYQIDMKFDRPLRSTTGTLWLVSYGVKTIPRWRTAAILKIDISPYLHISVKNHPIFTTWSKKRSCIGQTPSSTERIFCSITTTLLTSAKCTRPLFQRRTGCGGRPSGWHDIVTCQRQLN